jgi:hypothetical protein
VCEIENTGEREREKEKEKEKERVWQKGRWRRR